MTQLNPEHVKAVLELINEGPYFKLLGMEVRKLAVGYALVEVDIANKHLNPFGGIHGGSYSSLIDTAAYWAVYGDISEESGLISLDVSVTNLSPVNHGHLTVEGKRIKAGKNICLSEAVIKSEEGKLLAHGISKQMVTPGLQTMKQAIEAMGHSPLPTKFIH